MMNQYCGMASACCKLEILGLLGRLLASMLSFRSQPSMQVAVGTVSCHW